MNLYVCLCTLYGNPRMVSTYLMLAKNKSDARKKMRDGEHRVHQVKTFGEHIQEMGWVDLPADQEVNLMNGEPVCLVAGT